MTSLRRKFWCETCKFQRYPGECSHPSRLAVSKEMGHVPTLEVGPSWATGVSGFVWGGRGWGWVEFNREEIRK